ncbi:DUF4352 domain-containing protein [Metabacillus sp. JX24]|uniref:DUF4352 domain-containing protein n=1 Tax=Metabacillus sp. JX24 TaxID=3240759 RepID=UPI00350F6C2F
MKKLIYIKVGTLVLLSVLTACGEDKVGTIKQTVQVRDAGNGQSEQVDLSVNEQERMERLENGMMLFGETVKGGYYSTTVNSAKLKSIEKSTTNHKSVVVSVTIRNVRDDGKLVDPSELRFNLREKMENNSYEGRILLKGNSTLTQIQPSESLSLDVSFEVPNYSEEYRFYVISKIDPIEPYWKIHNLKSSTY